ncbi:hypothetical protein BOTBODRAFT_506948 [Botryobasidium botryosum FD-172 SS1]|uniref:Uncharacterized protein n=1 Tax=Botryobasidium botryosum (strain FD-172 SS1) TaxID=930990 RepID=A0A067MEC4_BOTB1|nr:hypothetical protein BOTBODRAFT_506948 [Botryobasidium botryosum FD-172 SS1]
MSCFLCGCCPCFFCRRGGTPSLDHLTAGESADVLSAPSLPADLETGASVLDPQTPDSGHLVFENDSVPRVEPENTNQENQVEAHDVVAPAIQVQDDHAEVDPTSDTHSGSPSADVQPEDSGSADVLSATALPAELEAGDSVPGPQSPDSGHLVLESDSVPRVEPENTNQEDQEAQSHDIGAAAIQDDRAEVDPTSDTRDGSPSMSVQPSDPGPASGSSVLPHATREVLATVETKSDPDTPRSVSSAL